MKTDNDTTKDWADEAEDHLRRNGFLDAKCIEGSVAPVLRAMRPKGSLNLKHPNAHIAAEAFWKYWNENGITHKHGYYESTWGAINAALGWFDAEPVNK